MTLENDLNLFISQRTSAAITGNKEHNNIQAEHSEVFNKIIEKVPEGLNKELNRLDELEGAINAVSTDISYKQGFEDGVRLMTKLIK